MGVQSRLDADRRCLRIDISGRFDFAAQAEFRESYRYVDHEGLVYRVNLSATEYVDSSALGMLLLLREHAQAHQGQVILESPSPESGRILRIAKFDQLFTVES